MTLSERPKRIWRRYGGHLLKILGSTIAIFVILQFVDLSDITERLQIASYEFAAISVLVLLAHFTMMVWRWGFILEAYFDVRVRFGKLSLVVALSELVGWILPTSIGKDVIRGLVAAKFANVDAIFSSIIVDRIVGLVSLLLLVVLLTPFLFLDMRLKSFTAPVALACVGGLLAVLATVRLQRLFAALPWLGRYVASLLGVLRATVAVNWNSFWLTGSGLAMHFLIVLLFWCISHTLGTRFDLLSCMLIVPGALLVASIPVSLGGWGIRESTFVFGFSLIGGDPAAVVATSVVFALTDLVAGLFGLLVAFVVWPRSARTQ